METIYFIILFGIAAAYYIYRKATARPPRGRAPSVGQTGPLVVGVFPKELKCPNHIINVVMYVNGVVNVDQVKKDIAEKCLPHMRFSCVPSVPNLKKPTSVVWTPVKVDLDKHFFVTDVPSGEDTYPLMNRLINQNLRDSSIPWWEVHYYRTTQGRGVIVIRIEHALGDGISLMQVFGQLVRDQKGVPLNMDELFNPKARSPGGEQSSLLRFVTIPFQLLYAGLEVILTPLLTMDSTTPLRDPKECKVWKNKVYVPMPTVSLDFIKDIKNKAGSGYTVNDVLFAVYAGTVRRYLQHANVANVDSVKMRTLTPLAFPTRIPPEHKFTATLRVYWVLVSTWLPATVPTVKGRLAAAKKTYDALKRSVTPAVTFGLQKFAAEVLPLDAIRDTAGKVMQSHSTVFSNVPGPQCDIYFGSAQVDEVHMVYPNVIPQVGILSVSNKVCFAMTMVDPSPSGVNALQQAYKNELLDMAAAVGADVSKMVPPTKKDA